MALSRERKTELVAQYVEQLKRGQGIILADYQGLNVSEMSKIRNAMRPAGGRFQVIKNRLLALALKEVAISVPDEWLIGPTAVSFCYDELPPVAKALMDAAREVTELRVKGGWMDMSVLSAQQVKDIAALPPRDELLAQALGTINAPASQLAGLIANGIRHVVNALQAYVDKLEESAPAPGTEMEQAAKPA